MAGVGFALLGAVLASFAGVVSERLNTGESWLSGRSRCNSCSRTLTVLDLIPVLSWLMWHGTCRTCGACVPYRYALTEALLAFLFFESYQALGLTPALVFMLMSLVLLLVVVLYDYAHTIVPVRIAFVLVLTSALVALTSPHSLASLAATFITAGMLALAFFLLHVLSRGRWMGLGDTPIVLALSLLVGNHALAGLLFSFWIGGAIGTVILVLTPRGHRIGIEIPFVPFLAAGYLLAFFTQWNPLPF